MFVGGMLETGVGRAGAVALAALDACTWPTDLGPSDWYFEADLTEPIVAGDDGRLAVPRRAGHRRGARRRPARRGHRRAGGAQPVTHAAWRLERAVGSAADFHGRALPSGTERTVAVLTVERPALVLGSTQRDDVVDRGRGGRRRRRPRAAAQRGRGGAGRAGRARSGSTSTSRPAIPLWTDDVGRSFGWLGRTWAAALGDLGLRAEVHEGGLCTTPWSRLICFAGLGPGEVTVGGGEGGRPGPAPHPPRRPLPDRGQPGLGPGAARRPARARCRRSGRRWSPTCGRTVVPVPGPADRVVDAFLAQLL